MKSYQFFTNEGRGGTMLCDDETLEEAVSELQRRFTGVIKVQYGTEVWQSEDEPELSKDSLATAPSPDSGT